MSIANPVNTIVRNTCAAGVIQQQAQGKPSSAIHPSVIFGLQVEWHLCLQKRVKCHCLKHQTEPCRAVYTSLIVQY